MENILFMEELVAKNISMELSSLLYATKSQ